MGKRLSNGLMKSFRIATVAVLLAMLLGWPLVMRAQNPQTADVSVTQPTVGVNANWANGIAPGYWPTAGTGLNLNLSSGTNFCSGAIVTYAGGSLALAASSTNYVYLDTSSSCVPAYNTTGFTSAIIPLATVVTNATSITSITDDRTFFVTPGSAGGGTGIASLNGLTSATQTFATGTSGTDFNIQSSGSVHTFEIPDASATARGLLTSADWSTFNAKAAIYGTPVAGDCVSWYSATEIQDAGAACGTGGSGSSLFASFQVGTNTAITGSDKYFQLAFGSGMSYTLTGSGTSSSPYVATLTSSGGGGTPGGSDTDVQVNSAGSFAGYSTFTFNSTTGVASANGFATNGAYPGYLDLISASGTAPTQPAGSVRTLVPTTGVTSYSVTLPATAPSADSVPVIPAGGGQEYWLSMAGSQGLFGGLLSVPTLSGSGLTTAYNHSATFSATDVATGVELYDTQSVTSGDQVEGQLMAYPSTAFTLTTLWSLPMLGANYKSFGILVASAVPGSSMNFAVAYGLLTTGEWNINIAGCTSGAACSAIQKTSFSTTPPHLLWMRLQDDGTTITYYLSDDGVVWTNVYQVPKSTSFLGSSGFNYLGVEIDPTQNSGNNPWGTTLLSWKVTNP